MVKLTVPLLLAVLAALLLPWSGPAHGADALIQQRAEAVFSEDDRRFLASLPELRVMVDDNFVPLSRYDAAKSAYEGISVDLFRFVADQLGLKYRLIHDPALSWSDKVGLFKAQKIDLLLPVSITPEREQGGLFTASYYETYYGAIGKKSRGIRIKDTKDLAFFRVGLVKDTAIVPYVQSLVPAERTVLFDDQIALYQAVRSGVIDLALQNQHVFLEDRFNLEYFDLAMLHAIVESPRRYSYYLTRTESNQRLAALMDRCLAGLDLTRLVARYERGEDELVQRYIEQEQEKKFLKIGIGAALVLLALLGAASINHRRLAAKLAASLEMVRRQQEDLRESEESYRNQFACNSLPMLLVDPYNGAILDANDAAVGYYGHARERLLDLRMADLDLSAPTLAWPTAADQAQCRALQTRHRLASGDRRDVELSVSPIQFTGRMVLHVIIQDITERKRAETALSSSLSLLNSTLESTANGILVVNLNGRITLWNQKFANLWRIPEGLLASGDDGPLLDHVLGLVAQPGAFLARIRELYARAEESGDDLIPLTDGRTIERYSRPQRIGQAVVGRVWSFQDITDRKRAEELRDEIEKIIHHDLRSPAGSAVSLARVLSLSPTLSPQDRDLVLHLESVGQRMLDTLNLSLELYKIESGTYRYHPQAIAPRALLAEVAKALLVLPEHAGKRIELLPVDSGTGDGIGDGTGDGTGAEIGPAQILVTGDPFLLRMTLQNLLQNALEASRAEDHVTVEVMCNGECAIEIRNQGTVPEQIRNRFFQKHVTWGKKKGTGLGTYAARLMAETQGGRLTMRTSDTENQTVLCLRLPSQV